MFQHTAARRRLVVRRGYLRWILRCFNTQPPEGGWIFKTAAPSLPLLFQHTAARRRLGSIQFLTKVHLWFQHTAARRRLVIKVSVWVWLLAFQHTAARRRLDL